MPLKPEPHTVTPPVTPSMRPLRKVLVTPTRIMPITRLRQAVVRLLLQPRFITERDPPARPFAMRVMSPGTARVAPSGLWRRRPGAGASLAPPARTGSTRPKERRPRKGTTRRAMGRKTPLARPVIKKAIAPTVCPRNVPAPPSIGPTKSSAPPPPAGLRKATCCRRAPRSCSLTPPGTPGTKSARVMAAPEPLTRSVTRRPSCGGVIFRLRANMAKRPYLTTP